MVSDCHGAQPHWPMAAPANDVHMELSLPCTTPGVWCIRLKAVFVENENCSLFQKETGVDGLRSGEL